MLDTVDNPLTPENLLEKISVKYEKIRARKKFIEVIQIQKRMKKYSLPEENSMAVATITVE